MKQTLILLAGYPGTGKTYLSNMIMDAFSNVVLCSPDIMKEKNWDTFGFNTLEEKEALIQKSWFDYYHQLELDFKKGCSVISDYPFSNKQKKQLSYITEKYGIQILTIRLIGDIQVLFERQKKRDLDNQRHLGHILMKYHKGIMIDHQDADNLLTYQEFYTRCTTRGYGTFELGNTIEIDVTDYSKVDYQVVLKYITKYIL